MGRATLQEIDFESDDYECQVCSYEAPPDLEYEDLIEWAVGVIADKKNVVEFLMCPVCAELPYDKAVEGYRTRMLRGGDRSYH